MEEGEGSSSHDKEVEGQNTRVGNAETKSNGRKGKGEKEMFTPRLQWKCRATKQTTRD
jgi:hypothetical protein